MKTCGMCGESLPADSFPLRSALSGKRQSICKPCRRVYSQRYVRKDREAFYREKHARTASYRLRNRRFVLEYLQGHPCVDCGENDPLVLEFDHVRDSKVNSISVLTCEGVRIARLRGEIDKCVVRCANCHRRRTASVQLHWKSRLFSKP